MDDLADLDVEDMLEELATASERLETRADRVRAVKLGRAHASVAVKAAATLELQEERDDMLRVPTPEAWMIFCKVIGRVPTEAESRAYAFGWCETTRPHVSPRARLPRRSETWGVGEAEVVRKGPSKR